MWEDAGAESALTTKRIRVSAYCARLHRTHDPDPLTAEDRRRLPADTALRMVELGLTVTDCSIDDERTHVFCDIAQPSGAAPTAATTAGSTTCVTRAPLLGERYIELTTQVAADERHTAVTVTRFIYQDIADCFNDPDKQAGRRNLARLIDAIRKDMPEGLEEVAQLGRTMHRRRDAILAYFDTGVANGPVEAINGRLEFLRGIALGFQNLRHYIFRALLHSGQLPLTH